jgi:hypothetical protein
MSLGILQKSDLQKLSDLDLLNVSKEERKRIRERGWDISQGSRVIKELCRRILKHKKEQLLEYYWFEVTNLIHAIMNHILAQNPDMKCIHFMSTILQMEAKRDTQFPRILIKSLDRKLLFEFVDHVLSVEMDLERDYWGMVRFLLVAGMLQEQRLDRIIFKLCRVMRDSVLDDKLDHDLAQLTIRVIPYMKQTSNMHTLFQVVLQKVKNCFDNNLEYQPSLKVLLRSLVLLLTGKIEFQNILNESKFLSIAYSLLGDIKQYFLSAQWYPTPHTHPIFGIMANLLQVCSILERNTMETIQYHAFVGSISDYLKWLILSEYNLVDFCPSDLIHPKAFNRDEMIRIVTPEHIQSVVEHILLLLKLQRIGIESLYDVDLLATLLGLLQLLLSKEYQSFFSERGKDAQVTVLKLLVLLLDRKSGMDSLNLLPKVLYEQISEPIGIYVRDYFTSTSLPSEHLRKVLQFLSLILSDQYCRRSFEDNEFFTYLVSSSYCSKLCTIDSQNEEPIGILLFKCIENALKDSAIRFKVRNLTDAQGIQSGIIQFLLKNIALSLEHLRGGKGPIRYMNLVFTKNAALLSEYFGYDASVTDLFLDQHDSNSLLQSLVQALAAFIESKLTLDPLESKEIEFSGETVLHICHLIDAVLRSDKGRETFVKNGLVRSLTLSMLRLDHPMAPSVLEKVIVRICTDPKMVHRMVEFGGYCDVFECLSNSKQRVIVSIEMAIVRNLSELQSRLAGLLEYATLNNEYTTQCRAAISIGYVCPLPLIQSILQEKPQQDCKFPRSFGLRVWDLIFGNAYIQDSELHEHAEGCLTYLSKKITQTALRNPANSHDKGTLVTFLDFLVNLSTKERWMKLPKPDRTSLTFEFPDEEDSSTQLIHISRQSLNNESPVFEAMLNGSFAESNQSSYQVRDAAQEHWLLLVLWINDYRNWKLTTMEFEEDNVEENCETVLQLFQIANRYMIQSLVDACFSWIAAALEYSMLVGNSFLPVAVYQWLVESKGMMDSTKSHEFLAVCVHACISTLAKKYS